MPHLDAQQLHLYLAGALEGAERESLEAHLHTCSECSLTLAQIAAEDAILTDSLALSSEERAWIDSIDLVSPVMAEVAPRFRFTLPVALTSLLILFGGYMAGLVGSGLLGRIQSVSAAVEIAHDLLPRLFQLLIWLVRGGLLITLWPLLGAVALAGLWHLTRKKETNAHA